MADSYNLGPMTLRITTWTVFVVCAFFGFFTAKLPSAYYLFDTHAVHRSDYLIGWFWMTVYGFFPAIVLLGLVFLQRRLVAHWLIAIWVLPALPVLVSAAFMIFDKT